MSGPTSARSTSRTTRCTTRATVPSAARPAPGRRSRERTCAQGAGGGRSGKRANADCTWRPTGGWCARPPRARHERGARKAAPGTRCVAVSQPPRLARVRGDIHPARSRRRMREPGPVLLRRQGFDRAAAPSREGFPAREVSVSAHACRHRHNFPEVIAFRDARAAELGERLIVRSVEDSIRRGTVKLRRFDESRNAAQSVTLLEAIAEFGFDAAVGGARRDEEKARAKEREFSFRDELGQWDPKNQRPELWRDRRAHV